MEEQFAKLSESEAQAVQGKVEVISYACLAEMNQFQQFRVGDFKIMMQNYLKGQIEFYQKVSGQFGLKGRLLRFGAILQYSH